MFADAHYDLLTVIYMLRNNTIKIKELCEKIYRDDNVTHGILNLFFMNQKEMKEQLNILPNELNVLDMLNKVIEIDKEYELIKNKNNFLYGIEGCDYLKIDDLEELFKLGIRSINPVWNNQNKYGSGINGDDNFGLTKLGEGLIIKCIDLGIIIDLSHANKKTFFDIIAIVKKNMNKKPLVIASHSNPIDMVENKDFYKNTLFIKRGLTDKQILAIKEVGGYIGIVSHKMMLLPLFTRKDIEYNDINFDELLIRRIKYLINLIDVDHIFLATDNMEYYNVPFSDKINNFKIEETAKKMKALLKKYFDCKTVEKLMYSNFKKHLIDRY